MPKVKPHRSIPTIDMTAMVDVAFLLLTFFILTTRFKASEEKVDVPTSIDSIVIPADSSILITVTKSGNVFMGIGPLNLRRQILENVIKRRGLPDISEDGKHFFELQSSFGVPLSELNGWLKGDGKQMADYTQRGIPYGEKGTHNELLDWVWAARRSDKNLVFAIRGDGGAEYPPIKAIFATFQEYKINRFGLVTNLEKGKKVEAPKKDDKTKKP